MSAILSDMRVLTHLADTGAAKICLPQGVQGEVWDYPQSFFKKRVHPIERRPPDKNRLLATGLSASPASAGCG